MTTTTSNATTTTSTDNGVSFKLLRDGETWGLKGPADVLTPGAVIPVTKRNGQVRWCRVSSVVWTDSGEDPRRVRITRYEHASAPRAPRAAAPATTTAAPLPAGERTVAELEAAAHRGETIALTGPGSLANAVAREHGAAIVDEDGETVRPATSTAAPVDASYRADLPSWEPEIGPLVLADNGQDCTRSLGFRTVRRDDTHRAIGVVGMDYTCESHALIARVLDAVTAWCGGRAACGSAAVDLVDDAILWVKIKLPASVGAMLTIDGRARDVTLYYTTSHNGSRKLSCALYVSHVVAGRNVGAFMHGKGASLLKGAHRHTGGIVGFLDGVRESGEGIPTAIGEHAAALRLMHSRKLTRAQCVEACAKIHGYRADMPANATREQRTRNETAKDRAQETFAIVQGGRVGSAAADGTRTALQVFEAACLWDVTCRVTQTRGAADAAHRHETRSLAGDTAESTAWDLLTATALTLDGAPVATAS